MFIKKYGTKICFGLILLVTVFLRFYDLPGTMQWWDGDTAEDAVYAYHITKFGEEIVTGRSPVGGKGLIAKSPLIYYFFSIVWLFGDSPIGYGVMYALINILLVVVIYLIANHFMDKKASLGLMLMMALSWCFNYVSRQSFSHASILIGILPISIYLLLKSIAKKSWGYLMLFLGTLFGCLHIHHSVLTLFPVLLFWGAVSFKSMAKKISKWQKWGLVFFGIFMLVMWLRVTTDFGHFYQQGKALSLITKSEINVEEWVKNCGEILAKSSLEMFRTENALVAVVFWGIVYFGLTAWNFHDYFKKDKKNFFKSIFLLSLLLSVFGAAWLGGREAAERFYVVIYYPLWLLAFVYVIWRLKVLSGWLICVFYLLAGIGILANKNQGYFLPRNSGGLREAERAAEEILNDARANKLNDNFGIKFYNLYTQNEFGKAIFWYPIERKLGREMLNIKQYPPFSIYLEEKHPGKVTYLLCANKPVWEKYGDCERIFLENNLEKKFIEVIKIKEEKEGEWPYILFRFREV